MDVTLLLLGASCFYLAFRLYRSLFLVTSDWTSVTGTVIGYVQGPHTRSIQPVVRFPFGGAEPLIKLGFGSRVPLFPLQAKVKIKVSPKEPRRFFVEAKLLVNVMHVFGALGLLFFCAGVLFFRGNLYSIFGSFFFVWPFVLIARIPRLREALRQAYELILFPTPLTEEQAQSLSLIPDNLIVLALQRHRARAQLLGMFLVVSSGPGFWGGEAWLRHRNEFLRTAASAVGEVISLDSSHGGSKAYYPRVRFREPASNRTVEFRHRVGSNPPVYDVGQKVGVLYAPGQPADAMIDSGGYWNFLGPLLVLAFSFLSLILGLKAVFV